MEVACEEFESVKYSRLVCQEDLADMTDELTVLHEAYKASMKGCCIVVQAQVQTDPTLAGMILVYTDKAKDQLKVQEKTMMMQTTGHLWIREEVEATTDLQRKYNEYLDSFKDIICYGFYHEVGKLSDTMGELNTQFRKNGQGAFAVTLTPPDVTGFIGI